MADEPASPEPIKPPVRVRIRILPADSPTEWPERRLAVTANGAKRRSGNSGSFVPGQSGNLKGRPKGAKGVKAMIRKVLSAKTRVRDASGTRKVTILQALVHKELELAINGDWRARRTIIDLGRWALPEETLDFEASSARETSPTDEAILAWLEDEIKSRDKEE